MNGLLMFMSLFGGVSLFGLLGIVLGRCQRNSHWLLGLTLRPEN